VVLISIKNDIRLFALCEISVLRSSKQMLKYKYQEIKFNEIYRTCILCKTLVDVPKIVHILG
jgi:hypothetical protein